MSISQKYRFLVGGLVISTLIGTNGAFAQSGTVMDGATFKAQQACPEIILSHLKRQGLPETECVLMPGNLGVFEGAVGGMSNAFGAMPTSLPKTFEVLNLDKNNDSQVSRAEFMSPRRALFDRLDTNKDGQLNLNETLKYLAEQPESFEVLDVVDMPSLEHRQNQK